MLWTVTVYVCLFRFYVVTAELILIIFWYRARWGPRDSYGLHMTEGAAKPRAKASKSKNLIIPTNNNF